MKFNLQNMNLTYIHAQNYRCFRELNVSFKPGINLFIGDNASGKTTILELGQTVCSSFLSGYHDENCIFKGLNKNAISDFSVGETIETAKPIDVEFTLFGVDGSMSLTPGEGNRTTKKGLNSIRAYGRKLYNETDLNDSTSEGLPVLVAFSTGDIHLKGSPDKTNYTKYLQRASFGYRDCFSQFGLLDYWVLRFLALEEAKKCPEELASVRKSILLALGADGMDIIKDIAIRLYSGGLYLIFKDGRETAVRNLSDGYRRLLDIVLDIAFRCALLNKRIFGEDSGQKTSGVVFIDEIDLHLHPALQSKIFKGLQNAFPNIQFIATTHAPLVISGIPNTENNQVLKLKYSEEEGYTQQLVSGYGQDASAIMSDILNAPTMDTEIQSTIANINSLIDNQRLKEASAALEALRLKIGNTTEVTKLSTDISFAE